MIRTNATSGCHAWNEKRKQTIYLMRMNIDCEKSLFEILFETIDVMVNKMNTLKWPKILFFPKET